MPGFEILDCKHQVASDEWLWGVGCGVLGLLLLPFAPPTLLCSLVLFASPAPLYHEHSGQLASCLGLC